MSDVSGLARIASDRRARASGDDSDRDQAPDFGSVAKENGRRAQDSARVETERQQLLLFRWFDVACPMCATDFFFGTCLPPRGDPGVEARLSEIRDLTSPLAARSLRDRQLWTS